MDRHNGSLQATMAGVKSGEKKEMNAKESEEMDGPMDWICVGFWCSVSILFDKTDTINIIEHKTKLDEMTKNQRIQWI